jgi:regulator of chromosome condensation
MAPTKAAGKGASASGNATNFSTSTKLENTFTAPNSPNSTSTMTKKRSSVVKNTKNNATQTVRKSARIADKLTKATKAAEAKAKADLAAATKPTKAATTKKSNKRKLEESEDEEPKRPTKKTTKKATASSSTTTTTTKKAAETKKGGAKRKSPSAEDKIDKAPSEEPPVKKTKTVVKKRSLPVINKAPTERLNVFVFGEGSSGELGLGHLNSEGKKVIDVKRPRLNANLSAEKVGVVQLAAGGMHVVALTHDNKILTWGVNDQGTLGRSTEKGVQLRDMDEDSDDEDDLDTGLNPLESTPAEIDLTHIPEGTVFTKVAAGDSTTMVLTDTGLVYGCGTFRGNEGILGFSKTTQVQDKLIEIPGLKNIVDIACGANHVICLDKSGTVTAFGSGQQNQLGRRIVERSKLNGLIPQQFGLPRNKITSISACAYHSFAIDKDGQVWSWGLNSFGETGIPEGAGDDGATILKPRIVESLKDAGVTNIAGGSHHSLATTTDGKLLVWGRCDGGQAGQPLEDIPKDNFFQDEQGEVINRLLLVPTAIPHIKGTPNYVDATGDHCLALTAEGKAYSWGFSSNYQTGQGTADDIKVATLIDNTAVREEKLIYAGAGGQYGILASVAKATEE